MPAYCDYRFASLALSMPISSHSRKSTRSINSGIRLAVARSVLRLPSLRPCFASLHSGSFVLRFDPSPAPSQSERSQTAQADPFADCLHKLEAAAGRKPAAISALVQLKKHSWTSAEAAAQRNQPAAQPEAKRQRSGTSQLRSQKPSGSAAEPASCAARSQAAGHRFASLDLVQPDTKDSLGTYYQKLVG
jgi:hypothetical protein